MTGEVFNILTMAETSKYKLGYFSLKIVLGIHLLPLILLFCARRGTCVMRVATQLVIDSLP